MFCRNCGNELKEGALFCEHCGTKVYDAYVNNSLVVNNKSAKRKKAAIILIVFFTIFAGMLFSAAYKSNNYVDIVRNGAFNDYPGIEVGDAFKNFFGEPKWRHFVSTDDEDIVEFTGTCTYDDKDADILIQFNVKDDKTFEVRYMSINDKKQNKEVYGSMIEAIYSEYNNTTEGSL